MTVDVWTAPLVVWPGQNTIQRLARNGDLKALEILGAPGVHYQHVRELTAIKIWQRNPDEWPGMAVLLAGGERLRNAMRLRCDRQIDRLRGTNFLALRKPGQQMERAAIAYLWMEIIAARFREAPMHELEIVYVDPGKEGAESSEGQEVYNPIEEDGTENLMAPSSNYFRNWSHHLWFVSRNLFKVPANERCPRRGIVMLSPTRRVRQSTGTMLVTEILITSKKGKKVWRAI